MPYLVALAVVVAGFTFWLLFIRRGKPRAKGTDLAELRQAENKVKVSAPILRRDIDILERFGSEVLQEAIELRRAQILQGDHPDSPGQQR